MGKLDGKYILITGASQGLGRQLAIDFAREGAARLAMVARGAQRLHEVRKRISASAPNTSVLELVADMGKPEDVERVVGTTLSDFSGRLDVLVNNASTIGPTPMPLLIAYPLDAFPE